MLQFCQKTCHGKGRAALTVLLTLALAVAVMAQKKKPAAVNDVKPADRRTTAYFDISKIVWPNPPAIARIKFMDQFTGQRIDPDLFPKGNARKAKQKWMDRLAGTEPVSQVDLSKLPFQLMSPYGVAFDSAGKIYAADQSVGAIFIFNPETKDVELIGNGRQATFGLIMGIAIDDNDRLFVSDTKMHRVLVFNAKHEQEASIGAGMLANPNGLAVDAENRLLYVVDTGNDVVDVFDADSLKLLRKLGKPNHKHDQTDPGLFSLPTNVAVGPEGTVYVTDTFNDRVESFDADGNFIATFGKNGDGPGDFQRPKGIAVDCDGHIWVVDSVQDRVKVYDANGRLLIYFGQAGYYPGQFLGAYGIAIDKKSNRVFTTETFPGRVQMFRYVTDAEAAAEKARQEGGEQKTASSAKPEPKPAINAAKPEQKPLVQQSQADAKANKDSVAH
jgi:DNA-binding beta-propeller fold protein YncE